jgi:hypothetical protein
MNKVLTKRFNIGLWVPLRNTRDNTVVYEPSIRKEGHNGLRHPQASTAYIARIGQESLTLCAHSGTFSGSLSLSPDMSLS